MKINFVTTHNPEDIHAWSGTIYYMFQSLVNAGFAVEGLGQLQQRVFLPIIIKNKFYQMLLRMNYSNERHPLVLSDYAQQITKLLQDDCELVFSPSSIPIAHLSIDLPIVFWTDATFAGIVNNFPNYTNTIPSLTNLCKESVRLGNLQEQTALANCTMAIYSSDWAAATAVENYQVDLKKIKVVPFGANFIFNGSTDSMNQLIHKKPMRPLKLLFVEVDFYRKGGKLVVEIAELLNKQGVTTELHIVGCNPELQPAEFLFIHGFLSKKTKVGYAQLQKLYREAHFFIMPSKAEAYGIVFAEASSFGLPSLATNVGGIPTVVRDGINGKLFSPRAGPEAYCEYILSKIQSKETYQELAFSSHAEYERRLNWDISGKTVRDLIIKNCS